MLGGGIKGIKTLDSTLFQVIHLYVMSKSLVGHLNVSVASQLAAA